MQPSPMTETVRSVVPKRRCCMLSPLALLAAIIGGQPSNRHRSGGTMSSIATRLAACLAVTAVPAVTAAIGLAAPASAQAPEPQRLRGQIVAVDGTKLTLKGPDGANFQLTVPED